MLLDILNNVGIMILIGMIVIGFIFGKVLEHTTPIEKDKK